MPGVDMKPVPVEATMQRVRRQRRQRLATRMSLIVACALFLVACLVFGCLWFYRLFYRDNPHFILRELLLEETANYNQKKVQEILEGNAQYPCVIGRTSLLNLDLGRIRARFLDEPMVKDVTLRRIMPCTLEVAIQERTAIAIVSTKKAAAALIDEDGILFPFLSKEGLNFPMPFIIKNDGIDSLPKGVPVDDVGINGAVALINEISTRKKLDGAGYAVNYVILNYERERLEAGFRPLSGNKVFPKEAQVWIPMDKDKMLEALGRFDAILARKISDHETLSFADVTLQYNVPTRD
ncbi:MAG: FtsQ-type POTRA domain-containing protein [Victivallales bacterium]|nr:FtsQ-type POTRA domain-containing protein [Victivallales bacterium]